MILTGERINIGRKTSLSATLSTTNTKRTGVVSSMDSVTTNTTKAFNVGARDEIEQPSFLLYTILHLL
jgi:hypothetical protein